MQDVAGGGQVKAEVRAGNDMNDNDEQPKNNRDQVVLILRCNSNGNQRQDD